MQEAREVEQSVLTEEHCYGRKFGKLDTCVTCEQASYCKDAANLPVGNNRSFKDGLDPNTEPGVSFVALDDQGEQLEPAWLLSMMLIRIVEACGKNPIRLAIIMDRLGGLSYKAIGERWNMSKQGVDKHLRTVSEKSPEIGRLLRRRATHIPGLILKDYEE